MGITKDADGQAPTAGQFSPQSPDALANAIEKIYSNSDRETNRADEAFAIRQAQLDFAECFTKALCVIQALQNNQPYVYYSDYTFIWKASEPVDFMKIAEGVQMVNTVVPGYFGKEQLDELLGVDGNKSEALDQTKLLNLTNALLKDQKQ
jgi:hypothetical protein